MDEGKLIEMSRKCANELAECSNWFPFDVGKINHMRRKSKIQMK